MTQDEENAVRRRARQIFRNESLSDGGRSIVLLEYDEPDSFTALISLSRQGQVHSNSVELLDIAEKYFEERRLKNAAEFVPHKAAGARSKPKAKAKAKKPVAVIMDVNRA